MKSPPVVLSTEGATCVEMEMNSLIEVSGMNMVE